MPNTPTPMTSKETTIDTFLKKLRAEDGKQEYNFSVMCGKCKSTNVTIYHNCDYYNYSSYTQGFEGACGLKCKDCGFASEIERNV